MNDIKKPSGASGQRPGQSGIRSNDALDDVVNQLLQTNNGSNMLHTHGHMALPSRDIIVSIVEDLRCVLFPGYFGVSDVTSQSLRFHVGATLDHAILALEEQIKRGLCFSCEGNRSEYMCADCESDAGALAQAFSRRLPHIKELLQTDVDAVYKGDPAATSTDEAIFCYPGVLAITNHRIAHELYRLDVPVIPRMIAEHAHSITGIDIHPGATIGPQFFIDHGTGVVIGETTIIGHGVTLYQGVTLGARSIPFDDKGNPIKGVQRHPIVEDNVVIYAGATILGRITIGRNSVIGGNVWLTRSVTPESRITQAQVRHDRFEFGGGI